MVLFPSWSELELELELELRSELVCNDNGSVVNRGTTVDRTFPCICVGVSLPVPFAIPPAPAPVPAPATAPAPAPLPAFTPTATLASSFLSLLLAAVVVDNDPLNCCLLLAIVFSVKLRSFVSEEEELIRKERGVVGIAGSGGDVF